MPFSDDVVIRDCPWCGLRDATMRHLSTNLSADRHGSTPRYWSVDSCTHCGGAVLIEHVTPNYPDAQLMKVVPEGDIGARTGQVSDAVRPHYEDAIRVLEAVGVCAADVDEKTARRALQFSTQTLRNLFRIRRGGGGHSDM